MEVIRVIKNKNYTTISNQLFKNKTISLKAKGLMAYLLSLPNDWNLSINGIVACSKEGRRSIGNTIKEQGQTMMFGGVGQLSIFE